MTGHFGARPGLVAMLLGAGLCGSVGAGAGIEAGTSQRPPRLFPDYAGVVIPPNIAPLNLRVEEPGQQYRVSFRSARGEPIEVSSRSGTIQIPARAWRTLLAANAGQPLLVEVAVRDGQGRWMQFQTVTNRIAVEPIDRYLVYRLLRPLYNLYAELGIYQRDLERFEQRPVLENRYFDGGCLNCHTFLNGRSDVFALNIRASGRGNPMLLVWSNEVRRVDRTMGYLSWHPTGRWLAFSVNKLTLFFHTIGETRDVFDAESDLGIYDLESQSVSFPAVLGLTNRNETWPAWAPDGRSLYYCSAPRAQVGRFRQIRYDLIRVAFDPDTGQFGEPERLVAAEQTGLSAAQPKPSPDGRLVLFCLARYGNFPVYQPSSDLYVVEVQTGSYRRLAINSDQSDSWHSWSRNGRWVVFSSKRLDGLFARPFFSYVDAQGTFHKPFLLPQADPAFYDSYLKNFNVPELVTSPITVTQRQLVEPLQTGASDKPRRPQAWKP